MGVEGQLLIGGFMAGLVGAYLHIGNPLLHKLVAFAVGASGCALRANTPASGGIFMDEMVVTLTRYVMMTNS